MDIRPRTARSTRTGSPVSEVAALYRAHFGYVWQVLRKLGVGEATVEDAAHDVFLVVHRRWQDFQGRSAVRTWLFSIARRTASRYRRADSRTQRRRAALATVGSAEPLGPDAVVARKEAWGALLTFLEGLDQDHREAFLLGELERASRRQMGVALGISPNTAYSRLRAARLRFAETFPDPTQRSAIAAASARPDPAAKRRVGALLGIPGLATAGQSVALTHWIKVVGLTTLLGAFMVLTVAVTARWVMTSRPSTTKAPATPVAARATEARPSRSDAAPDHPPITTAAAGQPPAPAAAPSGPDERRATIVTFPRGPTESSPGPEAPRPSSPVAPRSLPTTTAATDSFADLAPAMKSLAEARRALEQGRAEAALEHLDRSRRLDPDNVFDIERTATRIWALCAADRQTHARAQMQHLVAQGSSAAYVSVLSESCVGDMISSAPGGDEEH